MDLPSPRELELETLLRQRDAQVAELTDEVTYLRQFLAKQPPPSTTEPTTIPPALMSLLLPLLSEHPSPATTGSSTATTALVQRAKILQEENDELYELLKTGETGRLKEDVRALRRVVQKLEGALRESHQVIASLSAELEKSQDALLQAHGRQPHPPHQPSPAPRTYQPPPHLAMGANGSGKLPPTAPRAHKKPRLSESQLSPTASNTSLPLPPKPHLSAANSTPRGVSRDSRASVDRKPADTVKMEVDDDMRSRPRSPVRERDRPPHHDKERDKDRDRERDRQSDRAKNHAGGTIEIIMVKRRSSGRSTIELTSIRQRCPLNSWRHVISTPSHNCRPLPFLQAETSNKPSEQTLDRVPGHTTLPAFIVSNTQACRAGHIHQEPPLGLNAEQGLDVLGRSI
ncbi:hypothetical protein BN946_scf184908.g54 [Trametes cinnabarina]|uniref:Uncharacterized protein n=1 Tax=Pycnoporus cinnabarinus TaxID=5643 RepID=A0A060SA12_PYCCI|nr:hypothetical protein BN946_scf184908.g54 [Trametes cinnabarina]